MATMVTPKRLRTLPVLFTFTAAVKLSAASNQLSEHYELAWYFVVHFLIAVQQCTLSYPRLKFLSTRRHIQSPLKKTLMLYMEANRVDCENLTKLLIYSVDKRSFHVIQQVIHTISYYWSLYLSNCTIYWPHSYLSANLPENLEFFSLKSREFTGYYVETYADRPLSNPHTLNINNHLLPKSTLRKSCSLHSVVK